MCFACTSGIHSDGELVHGTMQEVSVENVKSSDIGREQNVIACKNIYPQCVRLSAGWFGTAGSVIVLTSFAGHFKHFGLGISGINDTEIDGILSL